MEIKEKGFFVVIEGGDGCGKSTLIENLKQEFQSAVFTREPGGTECGEKIRELLFSNSNINKVTEMMLFASARSELVEKVIIPNLEKGIINWSTVYDDIPIKYSNLGTSKVSTWPKNANGV